MEQRTALQLLMEFLDRNPDLPKAQWHMVRDGRTGWRVDFELAYALGNAAVQDASEKWAKALGVELVQGPEISTGSAWARQLSAERQVGTSLRFLFREKLVYSASVAA